mgnify:CR=1 FL=1
MVPLNIILPAISGISFVLIAIGGKFFFKEHLYRFQVFGILLKNK